MKTLATNPTAPLNHGTRFLGAILATTLMMPAIALSQSLTAVNLRSDSNFVVLAGSLVSDVPISAVTGDIGLSPSAGSNVTGFGLTEVTGTIYTVDATGPAGSVQDATRLTAAKGDLTTAFNDARDRTPVPTGPFLNPGAGTGNIGGLTLVAGLYKFTGDALITGSDVTLSGSATDVWIFQIASALTVGNGIKVILAGNAQAANIFWQVGTSATLGTTSVVKGTIMADQSISLAAGARLDGRALARIAAVTLSSTTITKPGTSIAPPGAPTSGTGVAGNAQVSVSWNAPSSNGGSTITAYTVTTVQDTSKHCVTTGALTCVVTNLTNGTAYTFTVTATNSAGTGAASAVSPATTPINVPGPPTGVFGTAGNTQISVSWTAPSSNGGSPISGYTAKAAQDTSKHCATTGALTCIVTGLTNGTTYIFTVTATNSAGTGVASGLSAAVVPAGVPGAPTGVSAPAGNAQAVVSWTAPSSNGGSAITGYNVTANPGGAICVSNGPLTCTVTGLTNGTAYTFTATATNSVGTGLASAASPSVTPVTVPSAPRGVTGTAGNAQVVVAWVAPSTNGGMTIVVYSVKTVQDTSKRCATSGALTCTVTGLASGTAYTFTVTATNAAGTSAASTASTAVTTGIMGFSEKNGFGIRRSGSSVVFHLPSEISGVRISIMDVWGRTVWSQTPGQNARDLTWNGITASGHGAGSGIYLVHMTITDPNHRVSGTVDRQLVYAP